VEEGQWGDHKIDIKMSYRGMQPTCSGFGTGQLQQEIRRVEEEGWGGQGPKRGQSAIEEVSVSRIMKIIDRDRKMILARYHSM
jgi:hypothetical protein